MDGTGRHAIDWNEQSRRLDAQRESKEAVEANVTLYGYLDEDAPEGKPGPVRWLSNTSERAACVAVLRRYGTRGKRALLILPGATAWRGTFFQPDGGLIDRLHREFDIWTLDWRGTKVITDLWRGCDRTQIPKAIADMTLHAIADQEVPAAVAHVRANCEGAPAILGHCVGGGVLARAIARGRLEPGSHVVFSTLALFYIGAVDTWLRANERIDQAHRDPELWCIDFGVDADANAPRWPSLYETFFELWTKTPYPHCESSFCRRMSSVIGAPYRPDDIGYLHDDERNGLAAQFGLLPLSLLDDIGRAVRRGLIGVQDEREPPVKMLQERFRGFEVTLITGQENQLWHRDSIDSMYEWLRRLPAVRVEKRIFDRFGHQDLWWSRRATEPDSVYEYVRSRLAGPAEP